MADEPDRTFFGDGQPGRYTTFGTQRSCTGTRPERSCASSPGRWTARVEARHLKMKVGRADKHWSGNALAVGLSQVFIEPLGATALHLVQEFVQGFVDVYQKGQFSAVHRDLFNGRINDRFEAVRNYIVAHYRVNSRTDTDYWIDNGNNDRPSRSLCDFILTWLAGKNLSDELSRQMIDQHYPSISWHCLLAGYGIYPDREQLRVNGEENDPKKLAEIGDFVRRCAMTYLPHRALLERQQQATAAA